MPDRIIVITGPTASGKTRLGVDLALELGGEVVSADSMQIYRHMDIGTAKPTAEEMRGVPHHMIDVADPWERYSVSRYVEEAGAACRDIAARGRVPIIVGGTGLYIESLVAGRTFPPMETDPALRARLEARYDELGGEALLKSLALTDPERAAKLHPNDKKRIVRALEVAELGGSVTRHDEATKKQPPAFEARYIVLGFADRQDLYSRIDSRVDLMLEAGLLDEVRALMDMGLDGSCTALQAIGYKEFYGFLTGSMSLQEAVETVKRESRRYAKRQISWCARYRDALRIDFEKSPDPGAALRLSTGFAGRLV